MKYINLIIAFILLGAFRANACDAIISESDTICFEIGGNYQIIFTGSAGTAPYTFVYSVDGGAPQTITSNGTDDFAVLTVPMTNIGNTHYTLISVTDAAGCTTLVNESCDILTVINPGIMVSGTTTVYQNSTPFPGVTFTASGGVTPYTFSYTINGGPIQTITSAPGSNTAFLPISTAVVGVFVIQVVSVESPFDCPNLMPSVITTSTVTITVIPNPMIVSGSNQTVCQGAASANGSFSASGSTGPYTYSYTVGGVPQTITGGSPISIPSPTGTPGSTTYTLTGITDVYGNYQAVSATSTVTVLPAPTGTISISGGCGHYTITLHASGGPGPFVYSFMLDGMAITATGGNTLTINGPNVWTFTTYTVSGLSVTNAAGCTGPLTGSSTTSVQPFYSNSINVNTTSVCVNGTSPIVSFSCFNCWEAGISNPTYAYKINSGPTQLTSATSIPVPTTTAGTYTYSLLLQPGMCAIMGINSNVTIVVKPLPTATISGTASVCKNAASPLITFTGANGTAPYIFTYKINGGANQTISSGSSSTATISVPTSTSGTFTCSLVSVSSAAGCSQNQTGSASVVVIPLPTATISGSATLCQNATSPVVTFTGANGTAPYTFVYNLNGGSNQTISSGSASTATISVPTNTSGTFTYNLVSVSSTNGCSQSQTGSATVVINPLITATVSGSTTLCQNDASPTITFTGTNGTAPYIFTYEVNGGANQTVSSGSASTATISVSTGTSGVFAYSLVSVSSATGCPQSQTGSVSVVVNSLPIATISGVATLCQNDASPTITFTGTNGTAPYTFTYNLNGGGNQTISSGSGSTATISVLTSASGTFTYNLVSVSGGNGCSQNQTGSATVVINPLITANVSGSTTLCQNDTSPTITFTGTNGTAPYIFTYEVNGGANQTVSSGSASTATVNVPTNISGTFTYSLVSVSSVAGCSQNQTGSTSVVVDPLPTATITGSVTLCQNDLSPFITFTGANGVLPYTFSYNINGGATQTISTGVGSSATLPVSTGTAGSFTYNLLGVSGATGCFQNQTGSSVAIVNPLPSATLSGATTICLNDVLPLITFTGSDGTAPYSFSYTVNGGTNQFISTGAVPTALETVPSNIAGTFTYELTGISDAFGCSQNQADILSVSVNPLPTITGISPICAGSTIQLSGSGTSSSWTSSDTSVATISNTGLLTGASSGTAMITYTNSDGCSDTQSIQILGVPTASISGNAQICSGDIATFTLSGTPNSTLTYTDGTIVSTVLLPLSGSVDITESGLIDTTSYTLLSVQGSCSQTLSDSIVIIVNQTPVMFPIADITACPQELVHMPAFTATSGTSFSWTNSNNTIGLSGTGNGSIADFNAVNTQSVAQSATITVTPSSNGCVGSPVLFDIMVGNSPSANAGIDQSVCIDNGVIYSIGSVSVPGNLYSWSPAANLNDPFISNPTILVNTPGTSTYVLTVTSNLGCQNTDTLIFTGIESPDVSLSSSSLSSCVDGIISFHLDTTEQVSIEWFIDGEAVVWNTNELDLSTSFGSSGTHTVYVLVTNPLGCSMIDSLDGGVQIYPDVDAAFTTGLNSNTIDEFTTHIDLINQSENATTYTWYLNNDPVSTETNPTINFDAGIGIITILLVAENDYGCSDTATYRIEPVNDGVIYVPNTFTPDGNGNNEIFRPIVSSDFSSDDYKFEIYNRWGELIFETNDITDGWNGSYRGEKCKTDTYTWKLTLKALKNSFAESIEGHVNLLK